MLVLASSILCAQAAIAQQDTAGSVDPWAGVEEMIVSGSSTAALLTPASTSAVAFDSEALEARGVEDVGDIAAFVPNLDIRSENATNASFFIRGVGLQDFGANASSAVPIIQDGIVRNPSATQLTGLFDLRGLSVLRGPQGSGNYRNSSAGVIQISTAPPEPEFSGYAQATLATITSVDAIDAPRYNFEAAVTAPIWEDIVSVRLSARYARELPWVENGCANRSPIAGRPVAAVTNDAAAQLCETITQTNPAGNVIGIDGERLSGGQASFVFPFLKKKLGEVDDYGIRAQLRVQPPDSGFDFILRAEASNLNRDSAVGMHRGSGGGVGGPDFLGYRDAEVFLREQEWLAAGFDAVEARRRLGSELIRDRGDSKPFRGNYDSPGRTLVETISISSTTSIELDAMEIELNAGFIDYRKSEIRDTDLGPNRLFPSTSNDQAWEVYTALDLTGEEALDVPLSWGVGGYMLLENVEAFQEQILPSGTRRQNTFDQEIYSFGLFANVEYEFLEAVTIAGGVRYNWEQKGFEVADRRQLGILVGTDASENQRTWDAATGFAELRFDFTEDIAAYLKYTRGFKAGHFNPSRPESAKEPGIGFADPEEIDSLEWGFEFAAWSDRLRGNGALFYYNYRNYQVFRLTSTLVGVFREIQNAKKARNLGAEISLTLRPLEGFVPPEIEGLQITFDGGWLDTEYLEFTNIDQRNLDGGGILVSIVVDNSGSQLISAPQLQATLNVTWPLLAGRFGVFTPQYDLSWTDDVPFDPNRGRGQRGIFGESLLPPYTIGNRAYAIHNVRLSWNPLDDPGLRVSGWCRNVTDQRFMNFGVDLAAFANIQLLYPGEPRVCGADVRFTF